jgi:hypothetical protein
VDERHLFLGGHGIEGRDSVAFSSDWAMSSQPMKMFV